MISAFDTGIVAGSALFHERPGLEGDALRGEATAVLKRRQRLGIAHWSPEEEFLRGVIYGYCHPQCSTDGLQLFQQSEAKWLEFRLM